MRSLSNLIWTSFFMSYSLTGCSRWPYSFYVLAIAKLNSVVFSLTFSLALLILVVRSWMRYLNYTSFFLNCSRI